MEKAGANQRSLRSGVSLLGVLVITVAYLAFEIRYNRSLLELFSQADLNQKAVDELSVQGKILASLGLVWALLRGAIARVRNRIAQVAVFAAVSGAVYVGLTAVYDSVIRNLSATTKVDGFHLAAFRQAVVQGSIVDPDVPLPAKYGVIGSVFMVSIPLILFDDRYLVPARSILELRAKTIEDYYSKKVSVGWIKYDGQMQLLRANYQQYLEGSRRVDAAPAIFRGRAREQFNRESGGMNPNSRATIGDFLVQLSRSSTPAARSYRNAQQEIIFIEHEGTPHAAPVHGGDLPKFMTQAQFRNFFAEKIRAARAELLPTPDTVEKTQRINDINSSVFIPPMAMATSLIAILANAFNALWIVITLLLLPISKLAEGSFQRALHVAGPFFTLSMITLTFMLMPKYVFPERTPMRQLEQKMQLRVGAAGTLWSRAAALQTWFHTSGTNFYRE